MTFSATSPRNIDHHQHNQNNNHPSNNNHDDNARYHKQQQPHNNSQQPPPFRQPQPQPNYSLNAPFSGFPVQQQPFAPPPPPPFHQQPSPSAVSSLSFDHQSQGTGGGGSSVHSGGAPSLVNTPQQPQPQLYNHTHDFAPQPYYDMSSLNNHNHQGTADPASWMLYRLKTQVEFYFSFENLVRDDFMVGQLLGHGGNAVPCAVVGSFPRVTDLLGGPASPQILQQALQASGLVRVYGQHLVPLTDALQQALFVRRQPMAPPPVAMGQPIYGESGEMYPYYNNDPQPPKTLVDARHSPLTTATTSSTADETIASSTVGLQPQPQPLPKQAEEPATPNHKNTDAAKDEDDEFNADTAKDDEFQPLPPQLLNGGVTSVASPPPQWLPVEMQQQLQPPAVQQQQPPLESAVMYYPDQAVPYGYTVTTNAAVVTPDTQEPPQQPHPYAPMEQPFPPKSKKHRKNKKKAKAKQLAEETQTKPQQTRLAKDPKEATPQPPKQEVVKNDTSQPEPTDIKAPTTDKGPGDSGPVQAKPQQQRAWKNSNYGRFTPKHYKHRSGGSVKKRLGHSPALSDPDPLWSPGDDFPAMAPSPSLEQAKGSAASDNSKDNDKGGPVKAKATTTVASSPTEQNEPTEPQPNTTTTTTKKNKPHYNRKHKQYNNNNNNETLGMQNLSLSEQGKS